MDIPIRLTKRPIELDMTRILWLAGLAFLIVYAPIAVLRVVFDVYIPAADSVATLFFILLAVLIPAYVARTRLESYRLGETLRRRENLGWWLIAVYAALVLFARTIYTVAELSSGYYASPIVAVDAIFALSFVLLAAGLWRIPWTTKSSESRSLVLDTILTFIAIGTIFWPLLIGPMIHSELASPIGRQNVVAFGLITIFLSGMVFWIVARDVRKELWPTAIAFIVFILSIVILQLAYLSLLAHSPRIEGSEMTLLVINAATSFAFLSLAIAAGLRFTSVLNHSEQRTEPGLVQRPVETWQLILPYPMIGALILMRLSMELFDWRTDYRIGMIVGISAMIILMMYRQIQMLRYNQVLYSRVENLALRDGLTGLLNHRAMHDSLHAEAARAQRLGGDLTIYFIDIDRFKRLNDTYGHKQGDRVLAMVADQLLKSCRAGDTIGRYGGEEFMVIAPGVTYEYVESLGERMREAVSRLEFIFAGDRVGVTVSIGVAVYPQDADDPELLIDLADQAMYRAKGSGRDQTVLHRACS